MTNHNEEVKTGEMVIPEPVDLVQRLNTVYQEAQPAVEMSHAEFFSQLMMSLQPLPSIAVGPESTHMIPWRDEDIDRDLAYTPDPRDLVQINLSVWAGVTMRFVRVLKVANRVVLVFCLPYGHASMFEKKLEGGDPYFVAMKESFLLLRNEIAILKEELAAQIGEVSAKVDHAIKAQAEQARQQREQLQAMQRQLEARERMHRRRVSRVTWSDPLVPALAVPPEAVPFQFRSHWNALFWHLVGWGQYQSMQGQQVWKSTAQAYANTLNRAVGQYMDDLLTETEIETFRHWVNLVISNPGMWLLGVRDDTPDPLVLRGGF